MLRPQDDESSLLASVWLVIESGRPERTLAFEVSTRITMEPTRLHTE